MNKCDQIKAHIRMEEKYERLSLTFGDNKIIKKEIFDAIESVKKQTGLNPMVIDRIAHDTPQLQSISIECTEDDCRNCGDFFTKILKELQIDKCEEDL
ncbi:MAG: hypothetical protein ACWGHH_07540 [Sulfurovaceae bacterium]|jgi:hypothetical protein